MPNPNMIQTSRTHLKSVRIQKDILEKIPEDVPFSEYVNEALNEKLGREEEGTAAAREAEPSRGK